MTINLYIKETPSSLDSEYLLTHLESRKFDITKQISTYIVNINLDSRNNRLLNINFNDSQNCR